jgi:hypothetical protein
VNAINQLLTSPRQTATSTPSAFGNNQTGAIAGIASTHKGPSIKVYKDQDHYELWEFVFTPTAATAGGAGGGAADPAERINRSQPNGQPGQPTPSASLGSGQRPWTTRGLGAVDQPAPTQSKIFRSILQISDRDTSVQ